ncbi:MAG: hypothetical protein ACD_45C00056G0004 [uncultured bacterium]|nr:MAG: hypothetical protein ACD_45C00056G0004 [uncultured bacterium]
MKNVINFLLLVACLFFSIAYAAKQAMLLDVTGVISPATQDHVERNLEIANKQGAALIILRLDTPGGLEAAMRGINKAILASSVPVVTYVAPSGARAASAGTFILYASHIAAMAHGTNVGAASPGSIGGIMSPASEKDKSAEKQMASTMEKKATHDAAAYIRSLAAIQGRNSTWAEQSVRESVSLSAEAALKLHVIDVIANDIPDLLKKTNERVVKLQGVSHTLHTTDLMIEPAKTDWRYQFLSIITNPNVAYILLLIGIYGLFFEFYNPGFILPGVTGVICLVIALYAFQLLPINYAGFALLLLGIIFMITETFMPSFGALGIGGMIAFIIGSVFLLDTNVPGFNIAWQLIIAMSIISAGFFLMIANLAFRSFHQKSVTGGEALIGCQGEVIEYNHDQGLARIQGEIWKIYSKVPLKVGQKIQVTELSGLQLTVEPREKKS